MPVTDGTSAPCGLYLVPLCSGGLGPGDSGALGLARHSPDTWGTSWIWASPEAASGLAHLLSDGKLETEQCEPCAPVSSAPTGWLCPSRHPSAPLGTLCFLPDILRKPLTFREPSQPHFDDHGLCFWQRFFHCVAQSCFPAHLSCSCPAGPRTGSAPSRDTAAEACLSPRT